MATDNRSTTGRSTKGWDDASDFLDAGMLALEPRILFDGAAAVTAADAVAGGDGGSAPGAHAAGNDGSGAVDLVTALTQPAGEVDTPAGAPRDVVFIDTSVDGYAQLVAEIGVDADLVYIDSQSDGVAQMVAALAGRSDIAAVHIISHGDAGSLRLGASVLNAASIAGEYADELETIGNALSANGDILIYGCNFGAGARGAEATSLLARATGADVAASTDLTGASDLGGDWDLEAATGAIEAVTISAEHWRGLLAPLSISANGNPSVSGNGSVGTTALWTNAGFIGGQPIDLRATVTALNSPTLPFFGTSGDDPFFQLTGIGNATVRWEIFQSGTNQTVVAVGNPTFSVADVDGVGGNPFTRETVSPSLAGLTSYATETPTNIQVFVQNGLVEASGTQNQNGELSSLVSFTWNNVSSWEVSYRMDLNQAGFQARFVHDGDGDFVFVNPQTTTLLSLDLDGDDSTASGANYLTTFTEDGPAVPVVDADVTITQNALLGANLDSATLRLTNARPGDSLAVGALPAGLAANVDTSVAGQITVTLSGNATLADYQTALQAVTFSNSSQAPALDDRLIEVSATNATIGTTSNIANSTIQITPVNDPPTVDLNHTTTAPVPGVPNTITLDFSNAPVITNDGQTEAVNGAGNGETAVYANVATVKGQAVDMRAVVVSRTGPDTTFGNNLDQASLQVPGTNGVEDRAVIRYELVLAGTNTPVTGDFSVLLTDIDQSPSFPERYERLLISESELDSYTLNGVTDIVATNTAGEILFSPLDRDPGTPGVDPTNAVELSFTGTSSFNLTIIRSFAGAFRLNGNFGAGFFTNPVTTDTNPDHGDTFIEGSTPVSVASSNIAITDDGNLTGATITLTNPQASDLLAVTGTLPAGISVDPASTPNNIILTGTATPADYEAAIQAVTFQNTSGKPNDTVVRNLDIQVTDDEALTSNVGNTSINVIDVEHPPVAVDDTVAASEDTPVSGNVLSNDSDVDGDSLAVTGFTVAGDATAYNPGDTATIAGVGALTIAADGSFTFTPAPDYNGPVPVATYTVSDGAASDTATLTVGPLAAVNDPPVAVDDTVAASEDTPVSGNVLSNDSDVDGDSLAVTGFTVAGDATAYNPGDTATIAGVGALTIAADGSFTFTPAPDYNGPVPVATYTVSDGVASDTATLTVGPLAAVNDPPVLDNDGNDSAGLTGGDYQTTYTENGAAVSVVDTDVAITDPDSDLITEATVTLTNGQIGDVLNVGAMPAGLGAITSPNPPGPLTAPGPITISIIGNGTRADYEAALKAITFRSNSENPATSDRSVDIQVKENADASNVTTTTIHVAAVNDNPVIDLDGDNSSGATAGDYSTTFTENGPAVAIADVDAIVQDLDNTTLVSATITLTNPKPGDVLAAGTMPAGITATVAGNIVTLSGTATLADYQSALKAITFANPGEFPDTTQRQITVVTNDGVANSNTATAFVDVVEVNDAPVNTIALGDQSGLDGETLSIATQGAFSDVDGDTLTYSVTGLPTGLAIDPNTGLITGALAAGASTGGPLSNGLYQVTVTAHDGRGGQVSDTFQITATNPPPVVSAPIPDQAVNDGDQVNLDVSANFADGATDGDTLTYSATGLPAGLSIDPATGFITGTVPADASQTGPFTVTVTADDGQGGTVTDTFQITAANVAPVVSAPIPDQTVNDGDAVNLDVSANFADGAPDGDALTFSATGLPAGLSIDAATGLITGTVPADASQTGPFTVTVTADDGQGGTVTDTFQITSANVAPVVANPIPDQTVNDGDQVNLDVSANFADGAPDGDTLTYAATGLPAGLSIDAATGLITGTVPADASQTGPFTVTITADDGQGGTVTDTFQITSANVAPVVANPIPDQTVNDGDQVNLDVSANFADGAPDGDALTFSATGLPAGLSIDPATGLVTGTVPADASQTGPFTVTVTADDGQGGQASDTFQITAANVAPSIITGVTLPDQSGKNGDPVDFDVSAPFRDADGDRLTYRADNLPPGLTIDPATGRVTGTLDNAASAGGPYLVTITADDGQGGLASQSFMFSVEPAPAYAPVVDTGSHGLPIEASTSTGRSASQLPAGLPPVILHAVNGIDSLDGTSSIADPAGGTIRELVDWIGQWSQGGWLEALQRSYESGNFLYRGGDAEVSLALFGQGDGAAAGMRIESLLHRGAIMVELSALNIADDLSLLDKVEITMANGDPLASYVSRPDLRSLLVDVPAGTDWVALRLSVSSAEGANESWEVRINTTSGEIEIDDHRGDHAAARPFIEEMKRLANRTEAGERLLAALRG